MKCVGYSQPRLINAKRKASTAELQFLLNNFQNIFGTAAELLENFFGIL